MPSKCGCGVAENKVKWVISALFFVIGVALLYLASTFKDNCQRELNSKQSYEQDTLCIYMGVLVIIALLCWLFCLISFCMMCCCTEKDSSGLNYLIIRDGEYECEEPVKEVIIIQPIPVVNIGAAVQNNSEQFFRANKVFHQMFPVDEQTTQAAIETKDEEIQVELEDFEIQRVSIESPRVKTERYIGKPLRRDINKESEIQPEVVIEKSSGTIKTNKQGIELQSENNTKSVEIVVQTQEEKIQKESPAVERTPIKPQNQQSAEETDSSIIQMESRESQQKVAEEDRESLISSGNQEIPTATSSTVVLASNEENQTQPIFAQNSEISVQKDSQQEDLLQPKEQPNLETEKEVQPQSEFTPQLTSEDQDSQDQA
eukprot:TRINITY_DN33369_c0_g1_i2.p1 TRINITY_DN33369_c0_g1~~TRINITY_DN33369_c0_g1_i2.p1  ORF type:complete len:385 (-),score=45.32 TRINITY_DN33369_c0_g1_i2:734-1852(-)